MTTLPERLLDPEQFQAWRRQPTTEEFFRLLTDWREALSEAWASGKAVSEQDRGQAILLGQLVGINSDEIAGRYGLERAAEVME